MALGALLWAAPAQGQPGPAPADLQRYADARQRGEALRAALDALGAAVRDAGGPQGGASSTPPSGSIPGW